MRRGFTRVFGLVKNVIRLAIAFAAVNIRILAAWHAKRAQPDPWAIKSGEPTTPRRTRARRRTRTYTSLGAPPPDPDDIPASEAAS